MTRFWASGQETGIQFLEGLCPDWFLGAPSLLSSGYCNPFPRGKAAGASLFTVVGEGRLDLYCHTQAEAHSALLVPVF
jgi:hypothetical protein